MSFFTRNLVKFSHGSLAACAPSSILKPLSFRSLNGRTLMTASYYYPQYFRLAPVQQISYEMSGPPKAHNINKNECVHYSTNSDSNSAEAIAAESGTSENTTADKASAIDPKDKQIAELKDLYLRCLAEQENLRDRTRREVEQTAQFAIQKFVRDLLSTVDVLRIAVNSVPKDSLSENTHLQNLYTGVSMTEQELVKTLKRHGVEQIDPLGEKFDPNIHEALSHIPVEGKEAGSVFAVQKMGYMLNGRVIRPPQVSVVKEKDVQ